MNDFHLKALRYVHNTGGGATYNDFVDDHEPIGATLWRDLAGAALVTIRADRTIALTESGKQAIA
jgi:hypothetical protein